MGEQQHPDRLHQARHPEEHFAFCIFHIIFTGFSLSWTRRILRQARIRDVKYYTNRELSPVLKGVFPQTTGCALKYPPSLHLRSNCCRGDIAFVLHPPPTPRTSKNTGWEGRGREIFLIYSATVFQWKINLNGVTWGTLCAPNPSHLKRSPLMRCLHSSRYQRPVTEPVLKVTERGRTHYFWRLASAKHFKY